MSGAENGAKRAEKRLERSGERYSKIKWSVSGAGAGGRRNGNEAVSGQNLPLKVCSTIKSLKVKSSKLILQVTTKLSVYIHYYFVCCVENNSDYLAKKHDFSYAALWSGYMLSVWE